MRLTLVTITICGSLAVGTAFSTDAGEKMNSRAAAPARVLNALDYGAVGDDRTDSTAAFSVTPPQFLYQCS
jgi:polygalacturonase